MCVYVLVVKARFWLQVSTLSIQGQSLMQEDNPSIAFIIFQELVTKVCIQGSGPDLSWIILGAQICNFQGSFALLNI